MQFVRVSLENSLPDPIDESCSLSMYELCTQDDGDPIKRLSRKLCESGYMLKGSNDKNECLSRGPFLSVVSRRLRITQRAEELLNW